MRWDSERVSGKVQDATRDADIAGIMSISEMAENY
jgi:hypothetical protein